MHLTLVSMLLISASAATMAAGPSEQLATAERRRPAVQASPIGSGPIPATESRSIPPAPEGVVDLKFKEIFRTPVGARGLEFSDKAKGLNGKRVRIFGHMVRQSSPTPWKILLAAMPVSVCEREFGLCDDLPPAVVHVRLPKGQNPIAQFTPGPLLLIGTLTLGNHEEADGRISSVRLDLERPDAKTPPTTTKLPESGSEQSAKNKAD